MYLALSACSPGDGRAASELVLRDSAGIQLVSFDEAHLASLETWVLAEDPFTASARSLQGEPLFRVVAAVRLADGRVAVANAGSAQILLFARDGSLLGRMGGRGAGPGQFSELRWLGLAGGDTLIAYDLRLRRLTWLTPDGQVVHTLEIQAEELGFPRPVGASLEGFVATEEANRSFGTGERRDSISLYFFDERGVLSEKVGPYPGTERFFVNEADVGMQFRPLAGRDGFAAGASGRFAVGSNDAYSFDIYGGSTLLSRVSGDLAPRLASRALLEREREAQNGSGNSPFGELIADAVRRLPERETLPAFGELRVARSGDVWVRDYEAVDGRQRWVVFDPSGIPKANAYTDEHLRFLEIGDGYVIAVRVDAYGAETLAMFEIRPAGG